MLIESKLRFEVEENGYYDSQSIELLVLSIILVLAHQSSKKNI